MPRPSLSPGLLPSVAGELRPFSGRMSSSLRMALSCVIVVVLAMSLQVPEAALSCYLVFFASRDDAASGILIPVGLVLAASVAITLGVLVLQFASDDPMLRVAMIAAFTFTGMYLSVATRIGDIAATAGFVFAFALSLDDFVPAPELLSRGLAWMWVVVFFPMATLVLVNAFLAPSPVELAREAIARRLAAAASLLRGETDTRDEAASLLEENPDEIISSVRLGVLLGFASKAEAERLTATIQGSRRILAGSFGATVDRMLASDLDRLAEAVRTRADLPAGWTPHSSAHATSPLAQATGRLADGLAGRLPLPAREPPQPAPPSDTFTNPEYLHFALKTLLAVFITYTLYTARGWFEVHTAMITCFYAALGTTGETLHKATLRIIGCLIGAAMGVLSIIYLMPHMTDIGHLMLLVAGCSFVAAWVSNGSELIRYAGWQMALAFFLCVLHGYGPTFDLDVAWDRVLGILIGNVVVAVVFLSLWPSSVTRVIGDHMSKAMLHVVSAIGRAPAGIGEAASEMGLARSLALLSVFEPGWLRGRARVASPVAPILAMSDLTLSEVARLQMLQESGRYLSGAPRRVKAAIGAQERSVTTFLKGAAAAVAQPVPETRKILGLKLQAAHRSLRRLERLARRAPRRVSWKGDLAGTVRSYRRLLLGFDQIIEET